MLLSRILGNYTHAQAVVLLPLGMRLLLRTYVIEWYRKVGKFISVFSSVTIEYKDEVVERTKRVRRSFCAYERLALLDVGIYCTTMKSTPLLLLCLLSPLMEVHSDENFPHVAFMGNTLSNNSYVDLSLVGENRNSDTVRCHTDLGTCCSSSQGVHRGDWFAPNNDSRLPFYGENPVNFYEDRKAEVVHLRRKNNASGPSGIYRCVIATVAVHNDTYQFLGETVYVGLYTSEKGT